MTLPQYQRRGYGQLLIAFSTWIYLWTTLKFSHVMFPLYTLYLKSINFGKL